MDLKNLITELSAAAGIGHINDVKEVAKVYLSEFSKITDNENYLLAEIGEGEKVVMLEAHMDEVGMIVTEIFEDGFLSVTNVGSIDTRFLPSTTVKIYGKEVISGVFTSLPPHLGSGEVANFDNIQIDTGRKDICEIVSKGDFVVFDAEPEELLGDRITSKALDNRAGMAAVIAAGEQIASLELPFKVILLFPTGEELGLRGARVAAYDKNISKCISVDVSFGDCPDVPPSKTAKLGSGAMIGVSPILSRDIYKKLEALAKENEIPYTLEVMGGTTSTDADVISLNQSGVPTGLVSIPLRNMHTPCEVVDIKDVEAVVQLLTAFVKGEM
ncbi:MAG: M20/M25/M40 family metallo-hydrolase [Ruminococcaceae bacterium]|nr:M20/M25/M40 family metallo-hydrolase [Oscillospiraceae bacterium]